MKHDFRFIYKFGKEHSILNRIEDGLETLVTLEMPDILDAACRKVIEDDDFIAPRQQTLGQVRSDESCSSGN
jgi:hypothetical protein